MAAEADVTTKASPWPVAETVQRLLAALDERGIKVFATIDQAACAESVGLELRDTVLIVFGNPCGGTPVMDAAPLAALDLPLKLLVWDEGGQTRLSYLTPEVLAARWQLSPELAGPLAGVDGLTNAVLNLGAAI
jgi:uncharacterized protein (DUF302 family)